MDNEQIETLIARAALGDRAAFSALYDATSGKLMAVCLRVLNDRATAEDAMQDAYVKIWNNADRYKVTGHSPMSWLFTIARNAAIDRVRKRRNDADVDDYSNTLAASGPSPEQSLVAASEAARILDCMNTLPPDRAAAIKGAYLGGETYKDLAARFDVPLNTMRTWLRRGLASLKECMSQ